MLEIPPQKDRLNRLRALIRQCEASVHDLSRVETSGTPPVPRFNMPFELGLVLGLHDDRHAWFVLESVRHRVARSLSDIAGYHVEVHEGDPENVLRSVTNAFGAKKRRVTHSDLVTLWNALRDVVPRIKRERGSLFTPTAFADLVVTGQNLAREHFAGALAPRGT